MSISKLPVTGEAMEEGRYETDKQLKQFFINLAGDTEEILTAMAKGLSAEDMRNFRLVSRLFYRASLTPWRKNTVLKVNFRDSRVLRRYDLPLPKMLTLTEFLDLPIRKDDFFKFAKYPLANVRIFGWNIYEDAVHANLIKQFFIKCSFSLRHVDFRQCKSVGSPGMMRALKFARNLKTVAVQECNLLDHHQLGDHEEEEENTKKVNGVTVTHLTINTAPFPGPGNQGEVPFAFSILKELPKLKKLTLHIGLPLTKILNYPHPGLMESLLSYRKQIGNGQLRIKIRGLVAFDGSIDELMHAILPMERWYTVLVLPRFLDMLAFKARKLRELTISRSISITGVDDYHTAFPFDIEMPALLKLSLIGNVSNSFNFLKFAPALNTLKIRLNTGDDDKLSEFGENEAEPSGENGDFVEKTLESYKRGMTMEYLTHLDIDRHLKLESLPAMKKLMPYLTVLKIVFWSNAVFSFVCQNWTNLKQLTAFAGSRVNDSGLTGIDYGADPKTSKRRPNLTNLKNLECFDIKSDYFLTDDSVQHAFLLMKKLKTLRIRSTMWESPDSKALLLEKFGPYKIPK